MTKFSTRIGALLLLLMLVIASPAAARSFDIKRGKFITLPEGNAAGLTIKGKAAILRTSRHTFVAAKVRGLAAKTTYGAHLHNAPCGAANPGGGHYMNDPAGAMAPPNELWLSSRRDATAGIKSNRRGRAFGAGFGRWVARPDAVSVVIHAIPPGGTTAGGTKIACADLT